MDIYSTDVGDVSSGNMNRRSMLQYQQAVQDHNSQIAKNIVDLKNNLSSQQSQMTETEAFSGIRDGLDGLIGANGVKEGLQSVKSWSAKRNNKGNALKSLINESPDGVNGDVRVGDEPEASPQVQAPENSTTEPPSTASPEGTSATPSSNTNPTAEEHASITVGEDGQGKTGSLIHKGIQSVTGLSDEAIEKVGKTTGALGSAIAGGTDLYEDLKAGKIAGDNGWEKAGNVTQIGGAISDIAGLVFPPAELVGGVLDLVGGALDGIGEFFEGSKKKQEVKATEQEAEEQQKAKIQQAPAITTQQTALAETQ